MILQKQTPNLIFARCSQQFHLSVGSFGEFQQLLGNKFSGATNQYQPTNPRDIQLLVG